jgi:serine/threonine-protein kinase RsbW
LAQAVHSQEAVARILQMEIADMAHAQSHSPAFQSFRSAPFVELRQSFPSQIAAISPFVNQIMRFILNFRVADESEIDIEIALQEALANAVIHGNGENSSKHVSVVCRCYIDGEVAITVRDEGSGFDDQALTDPTTPENRLLSHGRGIYLMKMLMDEVSFEERGAVVRLRKNSKAGLAAQRKPE